MDYIFEKINEDLFFYATGVRIVNKENMDTLQKIYFLIYSTILSDYSLEDLGDFKKMKIEDLRFPNGTTPMSLAIASKNPKKVKMLLDLNFIIRPEDQEEAINSGINEIVQLVC